ncbi:MAG: phosphoribosylformylglycinamidine synthase subunit PurL [Myxococcales bacterium]|nr:phosphoribosylformylglycinamidine synthase subunit PurL [Myxococcales bacterium]
MTQPFPGDRPVDAALAREFGLSEGEWAHAIDVLGRAPSYTEAGVLSVMWSEHCSYKSSRAHLGRLPTTGPQVVQGPGENAGAVDIGDGFCAVFKMESHNHPSYIEPYQGAATGVGGILRDVFTMGARPVASLNSLRFGRPDHPKTPHLLRGVVSGIGGYGNCIGVPTVGGELSFDPSYDGNILVNAFTVGVAKTDDLFFGRADGVGNPVIYVGARTGRDGIHGATMASAEFGAETESKLPTVQVGDPFMEKLLLEGCLEIFARGCLAGVQDMGAAGLTSSSVEMADRSGNGLELDLDAIPRRARALTPYEMLLSESQERMLMVAKAGREHEVFEVCERWDLDAAIVGRVTDSGRFVCKATPGYDPLAAAPGPRAPVVVVDLPVALLTKEAPKYERPERAATAAHGRTPARDVSGSPVVRAGSAPSGDPTTGLSAALVGMVGSPNLGSRRWVWRQFDHIVQVGTVIRPGDSDAAVIRVFCEEPGAGPAATKVKHLALSVDCNGRHVQLDPYVGAAMAVAECTRNVACAGARPLALTDCLNFGSPEIPETMWRLARAIDGLGAACRALDTPVVSGNVSLYNETDGRPILPTPTVAVVGQLARPDDRLYLAFATEGATIALLGAPGAGKLGGSEYYVQTHGEVGGEPQSLDLDAERALQDAVIALAQAGLLQSAHDVSDGGLAVCLAESCISGGRGARVTLPGLGVEATLAGQLFGEDPSRIVISFAADRREEVARVAKAHGVPLTVLGEVGGDALELRAAGTGEAPVVARVPVATLRDAHARALEPIVGAG